MQDTFADTIIRQPDFIDPVEGTAVWIGEDAAVEVPLTIADQVAAFAHNAGWQARTASPSERGVTLARFEPDFLHPAYGPVEAKTHETTVRAEAWHTIRDTVGARIAWLDETP